MAAYTQKLPITRTPPQTRAVICHCDCSRPGIGDEMFKSAGEPGPHHLLRR
jgi:hypothetical protein